MDTTKVVALWAAGGSSISLVTGSLVSRSGSRQAAEAALSQKPYQKPQANPFNDFDLLCIKQDRRNKEKVFEGLDDPERIKAEVTESTDSSFGLAAPSATSGDLKGCLRTVFYEIENKTKIIGATEEMALSRGNQGLILMNVIANIKDYGGRTSVYRAIFLEKDSNSKWQIKGGLQWYDPLFLELVKNSEGLKWSGVSKAKEINWKKGYADSTPLNELLKVRDQFSRSWTKKSTNTNVYQQVTVTDGSSNRSRDFWNGNAEPMDSNSNALKNPFAAFKDGKWIKVPQNRNLGNVKAWFNLFKDEKGTW